MGRGNAAERDRRRGVGPNQAPNGGVADAQNKTLPLEQAGGGGQAAGATGQLRNFHRIGACAGGERRLARFGGVVSDDGQQAALFISARVVAAGVVAAGPKREKGSVLAGGDSPSDRKKRVQKDHVTIPDVLRPRHTSNGR